MPTVREVCDQNALSQCDPVDQAKVSGTTLIHIELGKPVPTPSVRRKIAEALNVHPRHINWPAAENSTSTNGTAS